MLQIMKRIPIFYKTEEVNKDLTLSTRRDNLGNIWHVVEYCNNDSSSDYAFFEHLSSALDFIHSNFI